MYPPLTWQQEALALIKEKYGVVLTDETVIFKALEKRADGTFMFSMGVPDGIDDFTQVPLKMVMKRRNIAHLFVGHLPIIDGKTGDSAATCMQALFNKYGLAINVTIFTPETLNKVVDLSTSPYQIVVATVSDGASEQWYGAFEFVVGKVEKQVLLTDESGSVLLMEDGSPITTG